ncbi:MAG: hypothetical protein P1U56_13450 [Saprospiraceae bacterium]|nr:hypothetical protein [Saprospiraceae bacterium]
MMKKLTCKLTIFLALLYVSLPLQATEPTFKNEITREVNETFDVSPGVDLGIHNKYGNINITTWSKNQIQIDVLIKVQSNNNEKAQKFLDAIKIDFTSSSSRVYAKTMYPDQDNNSWWSNWFGNNKNIDFEVHYTIQAPEQMSTNLINKYGNIKQAAIDGDCDVVNKYGDIFLKDVSGDLDFDLGYGKAKIGNVGDSKMQIKYSQIKIESAKDLKIDTKYSTIKIGECDQMISATKYDSYSIEKAGSIKNSGKYDDFKIGSADEFMIDSKYTDVNIGVLNHKGQFDTKYGSVHVKNTSNQLSNLLIKSKYTGYNFTISGDFHLNFEGSKTDLHVSKPYEKYSVNKDGSDLNLMAYRGSKNGGAQILADMRYGELTIN